MKETSADLDTVADRLAARVVEFLWAAFAALLIAAAALVTMVRMLLPEIGSQRGAIEAWISEAVGRTATVGAIEASWHGWAPRIAVSDLVLRDPRTASEVVRFDRAAVSIAPLGSLATRGLKPKRLVLSGVALSVIRHRDGSFSIAGLPPTKSPVLRWLLEQDNFAVTEADLTLIDERASSSFALTDLRIGVRGRDGRKHVNAYVDLPQAVGERCAIELDASASPLAADWSGSLTVRLDGVDSRFLAAHIGSGRSVPPAATVDVTVWSTWREARLEQAVFDLALARPAGGVRRAESLLTARGRVARSSDGWQLTSTDLQLPATSADSPPRLALAWREHATLPLSVVARAEAVPLTALGALLDTLGAGAALPPTARAASGRFDALAVAVRRDPRGRTRFTLDGRLRALTLPATAVRPALSDVDGHLVLSDGSGWFTFAGDELTVADPLRLVEPLAVHALAGSLVWTSAESGARVLDIRGLSGRVGATSLGIDGSIEWVPEQVPQADLALDFATSEAAALQRLLPRGLLPERGERWLRGVLAAGRLEQGRARLRGPLAGFAALATQGQFSLQAELAETTLAYAQEWPPARDLSGHLAVAGRTVTLTVGDGSIAGASVAGAVVTMPDLFTREREVHISGTARGPAASAIELVESSPLARSKAARITELAIDGALELDLDMSLALYPDGPREVLGQARFAGNRIVARAQGITLDEVTGTVGFTRGDWYGEGLTAVFDGAPVGLVVNGGLDDPNYDSEFRMTGTSPAAVLLRYLARYAPPVHAWLDRHGGGAALDGELPWKAVLTIPSDSAAGTLAPSRLSLESSLQGLAVDLPWPFGKLASEHKPLHVESAIVERTPVATRIDFGDTLDAEISAVRTPAGTTRIERVEVLFGSSQPEFSGRPGLSLSGYIAHLPLGEWTTFLSRGGAGTAAANGDLPQRFDVQVKELEALGRTFSDVRLAGARGTTHWDLKVTGAGAAGTIAVPLDVTRDDLRMAFSRLELARRRSTDAAADSSLDPRRLPALDFTCASFRYGETELGQATVTTRRHADGQLIERVAFDNPDFTLNASGDWLVHDDTGGSHFKIDVTSRTLASLLERFGYHGGNIQDGRTRIAIDASWAGTPSDFTLDRINGTFELHVTDGRFVDIEPGSGRLFGLLSLQTLPRRLSFDFDDLFKKGFAFDTIDGMFEIEAGNAYTNGLLMEGPSARIDVSGRTGLGAKDYDQRVVVTPALSNTLPVAGALFGPIGAGAGAVYYIGGKMFKSIPEQINRLLSREYAVTGSWDDPKVERL